MLDTYTLHVRWIDGSIVMVLHVRWMDVATLMLGCVAQMCRMHAAQLFQACVACVARKLRVCCVRVA